MLAVAAGLTVMAPGEARAVSYNVNQWGTRVDRYAGEERSFEPGDHDLLSRFQTEARTQRDDYFKCVVADAGRKVTLTPRDEGQPFRVQYVSARIWDNVYVWDVSDWDPSQCPSLEILVDRQSDAPHGGGSWKSAPPISEVELFAYAPNSVIAPSPSTPDVPDGDATLVLLGLAGVGLAATRKWVR